LCANSSMQLVLRATSRRRCCRRPEIRAVECVVRYHLFKKIQHFATSWNYIFLIFLKCPQTRKSLMVSLLLKNNPKHVFIYIWYSKRYMGEEKQRATFKLYNLSRRLKRIWLIPKTIIIMMVSFITFIMSIIKKH